MPTGPAHRHAPGEFRLVRFRLVSARHLHPGRYFTCPFIDLHPAGMAEQSRRSEPRADLRIREREPCIPQGCQRRGHVTRSGALHAPGEFRLVRFRLVSARHLHPGRSFTCPFIDLPPRTGSVFCRHATSIPQGWQNKAGGRSLAPTSGSADAGHASCRDARDGAMPTGPAHRHAPGGAIFYLSLYRSPRRVPPPVGMRPPSRRDGRTKPEVGAPRRPPRPKSPAGWVLVTFLSESFFPETVFCGSPA
jgi:hypothetical protein